MLLDPSSGSSGPVWIKRAAVDGIDLATVPVDEVIERSRRIFTPKPKTQAIKCVLNTVKEIWPQLTVEQSDAIRQRLLNDPVFDSLIRKDR